MKHIEKDIKKLANLNVDKLYVVSKSGTIWPCELLDTLEATALLPNGFIIVPSYL